MTKDKELVLLTAIVCMTDELDNIYSEFDYIAPRNMLVIKSLVSDNFKEELKTIADVLKQSLRL